MNSRMELILGKNAGSRAATYFIGLVACVLLAVIAYRAGHLSFTHDEALSYSIGQGEDLYRETANHHWLNTLLMKWSGAVLGQHEWALRLPNVLAFILYACAAMALLNKSEKGWIRLTGAALLFGNPFLIEYFALARGYGLSIGFALAALYFLISSTQSSNQRVLYHLLGTVCAALALGASLSMVNFFIMYILLWGWVGWREWRQLTLSRWQYTAILVTTGAAIVPLYLAIDRLFLLRERNELYFGSGHLKGTFETLIDRSTHFGALKPLLLYVFLATLVCAVVYFLFRKQWKGKRLLLVVLLAGMFTGSMIERYAFGANYPHERAALYLIPLFATLCFFLLDEVAGKGPRMKGIRWKILLTAVLLGFTALNFVKTMPRGVTQTWDYEKNTKNAVLFIAAHCQDTKPCVIGNHWVFQPVFNYYIRSRKLNLTEATYGVSGEPEWVYEYTADFRRTDYKRVKYYPDTKTAVFRKREGM